ncbi:MAG: ABC transporter permease [Spirochaetae bacterium HGW-Spirochaetae-4]|nr:MAG: ABC transporter permease [Spirochaetae bacterium HGW-Spirochaetae-4]
MNNIFSQIKRSKEMGILAILVVISIIISAFNSSFLTFGNLLDVVKSNIVLGIMSMGMLLVLLTGGIDVSIASVISAVTVIIGRFMVDYSSNIFLIFVVGVVAGSLMGLINGLLIAKLKIPPIVATLGTMSVIFGLVLYLTNGNWITGIPQNFIDFGRVTIGQFPVAGSDQIQGIPIQFLFLLFAIALTWFILKYTMIGRGIYAIGGNRDSAERIGMNSENITLFIYTYEGFLIGLAGVVHTSIMRQVDPNAFIGFEIQVIAAVVLGGASVLGGYGSVSGTIIGVSLFCIINNGLILMHIPTFWQKIVVGIVLITSISFDVIQKRMHDKKNIKVDIDESESSFKRLGVAEKSTSQA